MSMSWKPYFKRPLCGSARRTPGGPFRNRRRLSTPPLKTPRSRISATAMPGYKPGFFALRSAAFRLLLRLYVMRQVFCPQFTIEHENFHPKRRRTPNIAERLRYNLKRGGLSVAQAGLKDMLQKDRADGSPWPAWRPCRAVANKSQSKPKRRYYHAEIQSGSTSRLDRGPYSLCHGTTTADAHTGSATIAPSDRNLQADPDLSGQS